MYQLPVVNGTLNDLSSLASNELELLQSFASHTFDGVGNGGGVSFLRVRKTGFAVCTGGDEDPIPFDKLFAVLLASSPCNHAIWYSQQYQPGSAAQPDLIWKFPDYETFPDALPEEFRTKQQRPGFTRPVWGFGIRRRTVWALIRMEQDGAYIDFERPVIFDIPSASLFGKSQVPGAYKWQEVGGMCRQNSRRGINVWPGMYITQIVVDSTGPQGTVLFKPQQNQGQLVFLPVDVLREVLTYAQTDEVKNMAEVNEKLEYDIEEETPAAQPAQPTQPKPQAKTQPAPQQPKAQTRAEQESEVDAIIAEATRLMDSAESDKSSDTVDELASLF